MTINSERQLKTGGDPRTLADYAALLEEMNKLTHPARPDVNWQHAETLCLSLFEHNGVELQTAAWYTLARTHLAGLYGMNEGLALLAALVVRQWGTRETVEAICCGYVVHADGCQCCRSGMADDACARFGANAAGCDSGSFT